VSKTISSVIVTPRVLLKEGIASLLQDSRYKIVAIAATPSELPPHCCRRGRQTLAITGMDRQNTNLNQAGESIRLLRSLLPDAKVMLVAETDGPIDLQHLLAIAPDACIFNLGSRETLMTVLELAFMDQRVFVFDKSIATVANENVEASADPFSTNCQNPLSSREYEILSYLAEGKSNKAIARLCSLSDATVKAHLKAILRKTNAQNRTQAAIWAIEHNVRSHSLERDGSAAAPLPIANK
jgi:two-component system, NarL family, nitrate/nitrite response regulator NarL